MAKERLEVNWVEWVGLGYTGYGGRGKIHRSQKPCENDLPEIPDTDWELVNLNLRFNCDFTHGVLYNNIISSHPFCRTIPYFVIIKRGNDASSNDGTQ